MKTKLFLAGLLACITFVYSPLPVKAQAIGPDTTFVSIAQDSSIQWQMLLTYPSGKVDTILLDGPPAGIEVGDEITDDPAPEPGKELTVEKLINLYTVISAAAINLIPYLFGLFGWTFFKDDRKRDLAMKALVAFVLCIVALAVIGPASAWSVITGFVLAIVNYNNVLKPIGLDTPTKAEPKASKA